MFRNQATPLPVRRLKHLNKARQNQYPNGKKERNTALQPSTFTTDEKEELSITKMALKHGIAEEYRITGELLRRETYQEGNLNGPKSEWHPNGAKILRSSNEKWQTSWRGT